MVEWLLARLKFQTELKNYGMKKWQSGHKQNAPDLDLGGIKKTTAYFA